MDHDDRDPVADLSTSDSETGTAVSPWIVLGAIVIGAALLVLGSVFLF